MEEVNKQLVVMVKDVVVGGPAYQEGQLQIGDILLSIDGKSVVSQFYNTVSIYLRRETIYILTFLNHCTFIFMHSLIQASALVCHLSFGYGIVNK